MNPVTLYNQSLAFLEGGRDPSRSFALNVEAAAAGYHDAVLAMGWYYTNGVGVDADMDEAVWWYKKSARQGEPKAMFSLGQLAYLRRDATEAMRWFERAAKAGHARSIFWVGKLHWHGLGVPADRKKAMRLFNEASGKGVHEAKRTLRWLSRR